MARILIVDDAIFIRRAVADALAVSGHEVIGEGVNGAEAVSMAANLNPDLVVLDINMPEMNGIDALDLIWQQNPAIRVLICSALGEGPQIDAARALGARNFLRKPFTPVDMVTAVLDCLMDPAGAPLPGGG